MPGNYSIITATELPKALQKQHPKMSDYLLMYSSWWNAIILDPQMMLVPIDDHMVHRGDAVFEAFKSVNSRIWLLDAHLKRLYTSAERIGLKVPLSQPELEKLIKDCAQQAKAKDVLFRLYVSRGPGGFSVDPKESVGPQIYLVLQKLGALNGDWVKKGMSAMTSKLPAKDPFFATIKSCNYLLNVLMKHEANENGVHFSIGKTTDGGLLESSTENMLIVTKDDVLIHPPLTHVLRGTTMLRAVELCKENKIGFKDIQEKQISVNDMATAKEIVMTGTTWDVVSIVKMDQESVGNGEPGPWSQKLRALLIDDQKKSIWPSYSMT